MTDGDMTGPAPARWSFDDAAFMERALALAARGLYTTDPTPRVGCVLVRDRQVVGEGWHQRAGEAHAEVNALTAAGASAEGASAYVTLEPCSHHGRTPPCALALERAGVRRVVVAMRDPNPAVDSVAALRAAGLEVEVGLLANQAHELNIGFVHRMEHGRPFVRVKLAMSLDGRTALAHGESQWITGPEARRDVQHWRARSSAIVTGIGTVLADDPRLSVRWDELPATGYALPEPVPQPVPQPARVVVDSQARLPSRARLLRAPPPPARMPEVIVACTRAGEGQRSRLTAAGAKVRTLPTGPGGVDLAALLDALGRSEHNEVLIEAGATLAGTLIEQRLADELMIYIAPTLLGSDARPLLALPALPKMADRWRLTITDLSTCGDDIRVTARPAPQ